MSWVVPWEGEYIHVDQADTDTLTAVAEDIRDALAGKQDKLYPDERRAMETDLDAIEEELEARQ